MKRVPLVLLWGIVLVIFGCNSKEDAVEYNDHLIDIIEHCTSAEKVMYQAIADNSNIGIVSSSVDDAITSCKQSLSDLEDLKAYDGDTEFRGAIKELLDLENHYLSLIEQSLVYYDMQTMTENQKDAYQTLSNSIEEDENKSYSLIQQVTQAQADFSQKYEFPLEN